MSESVSKPRRPRILIRFVGIAVLTLACTLRLLSLWNKEYLYWFGWSAVLLFLSVAFFGRTFALEYLFLARPKMAAFWFTASAFMLAAAVLGTCTQLGILH